jgi:hypothetical protein
MPSFWKSLASIFKPANPGPADAAPPTPNTDVTLVVPGMH